MHEQAKMPILCYDYGISHAYVDGDVDIASAQNVVINSKIQHAASTNSIDTLLVQQSMARPFLAALIRRLLEEYKIQVIGCPKTVALMGQMAMTGHEAVTPATEEDWHRQFQAPILAIKMVADLDEALAHIAEHGPCLTAVIATSDYNAAMRFSREVDATAVMVNASSRLNSGDGYGMGPDIGLNFSKVQTRGPIGLEQLTNEKYVAFGAGQLRHPHPVPETYEDAIMLKRDEIEPALTIFFFSLLITSGVLYTLSISYHLVFAWPVLLVIPIAATVALIRRARARRDASPTDRQPPQNP